MPTASKNKFRIGDQLGHHKIVEKLGEGGMGAVFLAKDLNLKRSVAIKILPQSVPSDNSRLSRFKLEAVAVSALNHPNILTIHEIGECNGEHFIVSEYVKGVTLREAICDLTVSRSIDIAVQVASALQAAHEHGIIHRDIKPENIMVRGDGLVKVLDFGLAKLTGQPIEAVDNDAATLRFLKTEPGTIMGTPTYMSPEQGRGRDVDHRTDIWSLGVVLFEMLAGTTPFKGETAMDTIASILEKDPLPMPRRAAANGAAIIVSRALQKGVDDRYQTIGEMLIDLQSLKRRSEARAIEESSQTNERVTEILRPGVTARTLRWPKLAFSKVALILVGIAFAAGAVAYVASIKQTVSVQSPAVSSRDSRAYDLYMRGKVKVASENREDTEDAIKLLEEAVALDPNFAEAYAQLARGYNTMAFKYSSDAERKRFYENAEVAIEKALELDPDAAEAHFARGLILWTNTRRFPHEHAIRSYKRSLALDPNLDETHHQLSLVYSHIGLLDEAEQSVNTALEINPNNTLARFRAGVYTFYQGRFDDAIMVFKTIPSDFAPLIVDRSMAEALIQSGRVSEAESLVDDYLRRYPQDEGGSFTSLKALLLAKAGKQKEAEEAITRAVQIGKGYGHFHHTAYNAASTYAALNSPDEAIKWLEFAADNGFPNYSYFDNDPNLKNIRNHPRFVEFMTRLRSRWEGFKSLAQASQNVTRSSRGVN
ncbi:MAG TPA: protein kinase [Pyrinomonadaceae bacterium]|nr:protein kinase [Pyrinomonadaceae bacterium]